MNNFYKEDFFRIENVPLIEYKKIDGEKVARAVHHDVKEVEVNKVHHGYAYSTSMINFIFKVPANTEFLGFNLYKTNKEQEHLKWMNEFHILGADILVDILYEEKKRYYFKKFSIVEDEGVLHRTWLKNNKYISTLRHQDMQTASLEKVFLFEETY